MRVGVVVLGDLGRSPRMGNHALSLANQGYEVDLIGYPGSQLSAEIRNHKNIRIKHIRRPGALHNLPKPVKYLVKAVLQAVYLLISLPLMSKLDCILVQTPPGVPTLPLLAVYSFIKGTRLIIDFHNYSHSILALSCGPRHPLVIITQMLEKLFGRTASDAFCVTKAMSIDLYENWGISAKVLYDRPPERFRPISLEEKHHLFMRLSKEFPALGGDSPSSTAFTEEVEGEIIHRSDRPGLLVSSTSWTEDEDFSILLSSLRDYEARKVADNLPNLICVITGKGELKDCYMNQIAKDGFNYIKVLSPWLEAEDYPPLLAAADIGVSLHTSSSGLDLPMKVVDMFGCGLPVAAKKFKAIGELVEDGETGELFEDSPELTGILVDWFKGFPAHPATKHKTYRTNLEKFREFGWDENWSRTALPVFCSVRGRDESSGLQFVLFFVLLLLALSSLLPTAL